MLCAALGFLFKDKVGSFTGETVDVVYRHEARQRQKFEISGWPAFWLLLVMAIALWLYIR